MATMQRMLANKRRAAALALAVAASGGVLYYLQSQAARARRIAKLRAAASEGGEIVPAKGHPYGMANRR
jgi:hypothetical protein